MPVARISTRRSRDADEVEAIIDAVYNAQRQALKVPDEDRNIRYVEHSPEHFAVPPGASDRFTLVEITLFPGRSPEAKAHLHRALVSNLGALGIEPADVIVILSEPPLENWAVRGTPGNELQIPFNLNV